MCREITTEECKNGIKFCTYCRMLGKGGVEAIYRDSVMNFACEEHKHRLSDSEHLTEADY